MRVRFLVLGDNAHYSHRQQSHNNSRAKNSMVPVLPNGLNTLGSQYLRRGYRSQQDSQTHHACVKVYGQPGPVAQEQHED